MSVFDEHIGEWLDKNISVKRMLEMAQADPHHPYTASETAFYDYVRKLRRARKQTPHHVALRFEGLPGEYLQIDWGEVRAMAFTKEGLAGQTRYFFAARLKYSRYMFVSFQQDMREERLLRCLLTCFVEIGGVPWVVVTAISRSGTRPIRNWRRNANFCRKPVRRPRGTRRERWRTWSNSSRLIS